MKFIDLFAGIGGFRSGFEKAGFTCIFSSEIDPNCQDVYHKNYGELPFGDIRNINPDQLDNFEVLVGGFPCQPFSICGKKQGFEDVRGTLFFEICRIIEAKQPPVIVLENVKHLIISRVNSPPLGAHEKSKKELQYPAACGGAVYFITAKEIH
jgi:DNA (cytosine-5)-methyltransferase 1